MHVELILVIANRSRPRPEIAQDGALTISNSAHRLRTTPVWISEVVAAHKMS